MNVLILGEDELREAPFQMLCFVTHFKKSDFIPPDAMAKLRQVMKAHSIVQLFTSLPRRSQTFNDTV